MARERSTEPVLPLSPVVLHILVALAGGARHGYAIALEVERVTEGVVRLGPGTLYGSLQRMLDAGLIRETAAPEEGEDGRAERRRYYEMTALGRRALREDAERLARAVRLAKSRLGADAAS
jgi:DNA-binding PadR family transcriptional regulator